MMKFKLGLSLMGIAILAVSHSQTGSGTELLNKHAEALKKAGSLKVSYTFTKLGGAPENYNLQFSKPNLAKIDTPEKTIVADGKTITVFVKARKAYYTKPQNEKILASFFENEELKVWLPFFTGKLTQPAKAKVTGTKSRKGVQLQVVETSSSDGDMKKTFYLHAADGVARQVEYVIKDAVRQQTLLLDTQNLELGSALNADLFVFKAPENAEEIEEAELIADQWFTDLEEAKKEATRSKRKLFVDFYADW